jgi:Flp pilus assembly protein protease CpaA
MALYYRILAIVIFAGCIVIAFCFNGAADIRSLQSSNDFINAMIHSPTFTALADRLRLLISIFIAVAGLGIGSFCFGIGEILKRVKTGSQ